MGLTSSVVRRMPCSVIGLARKNHQVFWSVVSLISVYMVNDLTRLQMSAKYLLCDNSVRMPSIGFFITHACAASKAAFPQL